MRRLLEADLWEISIVTFPMLPAARVTEVKRDQPAAIPARRLAEPALGRLSNAQRPRRSAPPTRRFTSTKG